MQIPPAKPVSECFSKSLAVNIAVKTFDCFLEYSPGVIANDQQGLKLGLKLELCLMAFEFHLLQNS